MKKLCLLIALVASPVFAQEEEQEIQIEIETGGGVEVGVSDVGSTSGSATTIAAFPDKSVWYRAFGVNDEETTYCWVDENEEPRCKLVEVEED